jgi:hypothetical protein
VDARLYIVLKILCVFVLIPLQSFHFLPHQIDEGAKLMRRTDPLAIAPASRYLVTDFFHRRRLELSAKTAFFVKTTKAVIAMRAFFRRLGGLTNGILATCVIYW